MPAMRWFLLSIFFLPLSLVLERSCVEAAQRKATIQGARQANIRVGPGMDQGIKGILKENEQFTIEGQDGEWYLVETPAGQKGYVHQSVVKLAGEEQAPAVFTESNIAKPAVTESKDPNKPSTTEAPASATAQPALTETSPTKPRPPANAQPAPLPAAPGQPAGAVRKPDDRRKSPSLIELLEGRETDMMLWAAIAFVFFLIGWICGGHYYLRRDRVRRNKLRF
jgi:hypothetical protein